MRPTSRSAWRGTRGKYAGEDGSNCSIVGGNGGDGVRKVATVGGDETA